MSKRFLKKNIKLSLELDRFLNKNPRILDRLHSGTNVYITVKGDEPFSQESKTIVERMKKRKQQKFIEARKQGSRWILVAA